MYRPSFIYHQGCAALSIIATIILLPLLFRYKDGRMDFYQLSMYILILSISWGLHGLLHFYEEIHYNYNPLDGRTTILATPTRKHIDGQYKENFNM
jgi:hypothetical protein